MITLYKIYVLVPAKKCCKLQAELKTAMEEVDLKRVMIIHEQLGDCCCKVNIYREALLHYNKQVFTFIIMLMMGLQ